MNTSRAALITGMISAAAVVGCTSPVHHAVTPAMIRVPPRTSLHTSPAATTSAPARSSHVGTPASSAPQPTPVVAHRSAGGGGRTVGAVLATLAVKGRAPMTGYSRDEFGSAWTDDNDDPLGHNGCDTRNDILRRDLRAVEIDPGTSGCVVVSGRLPDPYTGTTLDFVRGVTTSWQVQIDHVVALGDAWQTGAQQLSDAARIDLANDPLNLLAVDGHDNEAKGDGDAATWLPPNKAYRCDYVARQVAVKARYHLWVTAAEHDAITRVLTTCPGRRVPTEAALRVHLRGTASPARTPTPSPPPAPSAGCTRTSSGNCIEGGEFCPQASYGTVGIDGEGRRYVCTGDEGHPHWGLP